MKNQVLYFSEFAQINEAKSPQKIKIVLFSNKSEKSYTVPALEKECKARGITLKVIDVGSCVITEDKSNKADLLISDSSEKKPFPISTEDTAILTRRGVVRSTITQDNIQKLEDKGFFIVNSLDSVLACENKYTTSKILLNSGIPVPKMAIIDSEASIEPGLKAIGGKFPVVLKLLSGSQGIGVSIVDSLASLKSVMQTFRKLNDGLEILIQEKIDTEYDLRIHVLTKRFNSPRPEDTDSVILGAMRRNKVDKDFRTNYSLGGTVEKTKLTEEQQKIAIDAAKAIGCNWCGVDLIVDKHTGKSYVLEVNASPGTQGLKKATGIDVVKDILDFLEDRNNRIRSKKIIGFREVITIPGIGDVVAKFDTGNGSLSSSLTYDKMEVSKDKKTVQWSIGKKTFKSKIIGSSVTEVGTEKHDRVIIQLDVEFCGKMYKAVDVSLVDRTDKSTKFLVNRKFMERIGCSVSPSKTFIVTSFDGDYHAGEAKGDNHSGLKFE